MPLRFAARCRKSLGEFPSVEIQASCTEPYNKGRYFRKGAKTLSSERKSLCHFDPREKSFLDPSHSLGMTGLGPSPLRLRAFAGDNPSFGRDPWLPLSVLCWAC